MDVRGADGVVGSLHSIWAAFCINLEEAFALSCCICPLIVIHVLDYNVIRIPDAFRACSVRNRAMLQCWYSQ